MLEFLELLHYFMTPINKKYLIRKKYLAAFYNLAFLNKSIIILHFFLIIIIEVAIPHFGNYFTVIIKPVKQNHIHFYSLS